MTATANPTPPRNFAAEFAALMAEQADLTRRAFRLFEAACGQPAAATADPAPEGSVKLFDAGGKGIEVGGPIMLKGPSAALTQSAAALDAAARELADSIPTVAPAGAAVPKPTPAPAQLEPPTDRDLILDLYASTTLTTTLMAERLGLPQSKVQGTIAGCRRGKNPRVLMGDAARQAAPVPMPAPRPSIIPPLAPAPRAPKAVAAKPAAPVEPLPPVRTPAEAKARADARAQVLRHYGETGDYDGQTAQKLGVLRAWVAAFIHDAREARDPRVTVGDGRRRMREKA